MFGLSGFGRNRVHVADRREKEISQCACVLHIEAHSVNRFATSADHGGQPTGRDHGDGCDAGIPCEVKQDQAGRVGVQLGGNPARLFVALVTRLSERHVPKCLNGYSEVNP